VWNENARAGVRLGRCARLNAANAQHAHVPERGVLHAANKPRNQRYEGGVMRGESHQRVRKAGVTSRQARILAPAARHACAGR